MNSIAHQILSEIADIPLEQYRRELSEYTAMRARQRSLELTLREKQVYLMVVEDAMNLQSIADHTGICADTVKRHLSSVYNKTGTTGRLELAVGYWKTKYQNLEQKQRGIQ